MKFLFCGSSDKEISVWPWRVVFLSNALGSAVTVYIAVNEYMTDLYGLHLFNSMTQLLWWIMFVMCLLKSPSLVQDPTVDSSQSKYSYETVIKQMGHWPPKVVLPPVCHTCHLSKPLRSKHCKILGRCVNKFDHFW